MAVMKIPSAARYRKRVGAFGDMDVKHDQSVLKFNTAARCYNFDFSSGALRAGYGTEINPVVPEEAQRYWIYRYYSDKTEGYVDQYVYQDKYGRLKLFDGITKEILFISGRAFAPMQALNYRLNGKDVLLLSCEEQKLMSWNGSRLNEYEDSPLISSMALHYERLFVTSPTEPTKVFFSDDLDPTNWAISGEEGGFIELLDERGELVSVQSFGNYLYIFREHGISRVTAFGDQSEFSVVNLFVTAGRIFPTSISKCGSGIMFLASDGLYMFDGYDCTRVFTNLDGLIVPDDNCAAVFFNGKYYLSCAMNFCDGRTVGCEAGEHNVNGLLICDVATGEYSVTRGVDISFMNACTFLGEDFLMCCDGGVGCVITRCGGRRGVPLDRLWQSPETDFSAPDLTKSVRELYIKTQTPCVVTLRSDRKTKRIEVKSGDRRVRVNFNAKRLSLAVETDGADCDIKAPTLIYSSY